MKTYVFKGPAKGSAKRLSIRGNLLEKGKEFKTDDRQLIQALEEHPLVEPVKPSPKKDAQ